MKLRALLPTLACLLLAACTDFPSIEANQCGNTVIEPGEDCDTFALPELRGSVCRPKGVVGECHLDCAAHRDGSRPTCPDGSGCAADNICRKPTGDFQLPPLKLTSDVSSWVSSLDFDGDGRLDLISADPPDQMQQARFKLHYFDVDGKLVESRVFPRIATRPVARDVTGDHAADLVFSTARVSMVPGRKDREWVPATFSSYVVDNDGARAVSVSNDNVGDSVALAVLTAFDAGPGVYVPSGDRSTFLPLGSLPHSVHQLAGDPLAANLVEGAGSPCDDLLIAFLGDDSFQLMDLCEPGTSPEQTPIIWRSELQQQVVKLPRGAKIDAAPVVTDLDGDGHLDVLIGARGKVFVAHGTGAGLEPLATPFLPELRDPSRPFAMPLAAGDLTGDGVVDFVLPKRVLGSQKSASDGSVRYVETFTNIAQPWTMAQVADLNGNGLLDVIAATAGAPGLMFLSGTGNLYPVGARIASQGAVRFLTNGDFDGDLLPDVAFVESGKASTEQEFLSVAFSQRDRVPLDPARIASLNGVEQLGRNRDFALDDVFTSSTVTEAGKPRTTFTLFGGDVERLPIAPYTLVTFANNGSLQDALANALIVGEFRKKGSSDVVALGRRQLEPDWSLWLVPNIGVGRDTPQLLTSEKALAPLAATPESTQDGVKRLSAAGVAADLDGDGLDEAIWLMPRPNGCALLVYDVVTSAPRMNKPARPTAELRGQLALDEPCPTPELGALQLREPGVFDLVALVGDPALGPRKLAVFWNSNHGEFAAENRFDIVIHGRNVHDIHDVRAFSAFPRPAAGLALVSDWGLHIVTSQEDALKLNHVVDVQQLDDAQGVAVTDPNGDGIADIVAADAEGLWLLQAAFQ